MYLYFLQHLQKIRFVFQFFRYLFINRNDISCLQKQNFFIVNSFVGKKRFHSFPKSFIVGQLFMIKFVIVIPFSLSCYRNAQTPSRNVDLPSCSTLVFEILIPQSSPSRNSFYNFLIHESITISSNIFLLFWSYRSSRPEAFLRKGVLKICSKFKGEHPYEVLFCKATLLKQHFAMCVLL